MKWSQLEYMLDVYHFRIGEDGIIHFYIHCMNFVVLEDFKQHFPCTDTAGLTAGYWRIENRQLFRDEK